MDQTGNLLKQFDYPKDIVRTSVAARSFAAGLYTIAAYNGIEWDHKQVIKQ